MGVKVNIRCAGIVYNGRGVLLVESIYNGKTYWILPGGGLEEKESLRECVMREVMEETGIHVTVGRLIFLDEGVIGQNPTIHFTFLCTPKKGKLSVGVDPEKKEKIISNVRYFTPLEVSNLENFIPLKMKSYLVRAMKEKFPNNEVISLNEK